MITALCLLLSAAMAYTPLPADAITARMILIEVALHDGVKQSGSPKDPGQCKRFQANAFAEAAAGFMLAAYPDAELYLPMEHADPKNSGRFLGVCWDMPGPETGNAFEEIARFDADPNGTKAGNTKAAKAFLAQARAGDILQVVGTYIPSGRGTHTLMFTRPYDPRSNTLYWADSNFGSRIVNEIKYGVVRAYQQRSLDEVAGWLTAQEGNGATLYRIRRDVVKRTE